MRRSVLILALLPAFAWAGTHVSANYKDAKLGANYYAGNSAIDGKKETAWMVPGESDNKGEWIDIDVPRGDVDKISIFPGFGKTEETFQDYSRLKQARVDVFAFDDDQNPKQVGTATIDIADKPEVQVFDLPDTKIAEGLFGGKVRVTVLAVYEGEDYPNLAISELLVHLKEFEAKVTVSEISGEVDGRGRDQMLDENPKTSWAVAGSTATMTLQTAGFGLSTIGFTSAGKDYARPKTVEIKAGNMTVQTVLPDCIKDPQWATVPGFNGYTGGAFGDIELTILDTYPGAKPELGLGVSELKARATNFETI